MASQVTLRRSLKTWKIYGANTNVGKTIMSTILCKAFLRNFPEEEISYLKPISTGPAWEADDMHISKFTSRPVDTKCLFQFNQAVSPHIAARSSIVSNF
jgi:dethiobiotin synthetase/adenosylmethionine--8-amino-7-oxononanoate aminotransferase